MKKRVLSIVCVVALIATMISAGAIYAIGTDSVALEDEAFAFAGNTFVDTDWTATNSTPEFGETGVKLNSVNDTTYATIKYKDSYNLTNGFTLEYVAKAKAQSNTITAGTYFTGVQIGNVTVAMNQFIKPVILVDGAVKATGTAIADVTEGADIRTWVNDTEPAIDNIKYTVTYDVNTKTLTYARYHGETQVFSLAYTDATRLIDVESADVVLYHNNNKRSFATYKSIKLTGVSADSVITPSVLYGTGLEVSASKPTTPDKWTMSNSKCVAGKGITVHANSGNNLNKVTYNESFVLTEGFKLTFNGCIESTSNSAGQPGKNFLGAKVGNITAAIRVVDTKDALVMVIAVDGAVVATSDVIYDKNDPVWTRETAARNIEYFLSTYYMGNSEFVLSYDPATKTVTYSLTVGSIEEGTVTYVDDADAIDLSDAVLEFQSQGAWNAHAYYKTIKLEGATCTEHVYDDDNDTTCNKCGESRAIGGGEGEEAVVKGETLTKWEPESFVEADWMDSAGKFDDGKFLIVSGNGTKTVWTEKNYDLSVGFKFKGKLAMKNGYNNYYGEWCSAYFGNEDANLELRIRNDWRSGEKDNTYTAYIIHKGVTLASSDLVTLPNGEYELSYKDGKVSVNLGGTAIKWTLEGTETVTTSVDVADVDLYNAKLGLRLSGNYCPNGRQWSAISLESLASSSNGAVSTGDARNIVFPAAVMLISAVAVAFVSLRKKSLA